MTETKLYTASGCAPCAATKLYLQQNNIRYTELGIEDAVQAGYRSVPVLVHGDTVIMGYDVKKIKETFLNE